MLGSETFPFDWGALARKTACRIRREGRLAGPVAEALVRSVHALINKAGWRLDEALYPNWRETSLQGPIVIVGHQRSATTFLHRALVEDVLPHGTGMTLAEMLCPPLTLRRLFESPSELPDPAGDVLEAVVERAERALFEPIEPLHHIRFDAIEEDEFALMAMFASGMCVNDRPSTLAAPELDPLRRPEKRPVERQLRTLKTYRKCLLKTAADDDAATPVLVAKNPAFSKRIPLVRRVFPNARFVHLVRNPIDAVAGRLELVERIWRRRSGEPALAPVHVRRLLRDSIAIYRGAERGLAELPDEDTYAVRFDAFVADPASHVADLVERFELGPVDDAFRSALEARSDRERQKDRDRATLRDFGLHPDDVRQPLTEVFVRWDFATREIRRRAA